MQVSRIKWCVVLMTTMTFFGLSILLHVSEIFCAEASMGDCGGIFKQKRGMIYSPGFPRKYVWTEEDQDCVWNIYGPSGTVLESEFIKFDLDNLYTIEIIDMASNNEQIFTKDSDQSVEPTTSNEMKVKFLYEAVSNHLELSAKFALKWKAKIAKYDSTLCSDNGIFLSPFYPYDYPEDMFYTWYIHTSSSSLVKIEFVEFLLREGDFVEVGDSDQDRSSLGRYNSSYRLPEVPYSRSNQSVVGLSAESVTNPTDGKFRAIFYAVWKCHDNQTVENGYIYPMVEYMYTPGETLALECDLGYYPSTNFTIVTCLEDGTWDGSLSDCIIVSCGDPGDPDLGVKFGDNFTYDSKIHFSCNEGYELNGTDTIVCQANGTWSDDPPTCIIINCGEPEDIDNADKDGDTFTYNNTVSYTCHDKYVLEDGNGTVVCGEDGEWSDAPTCVPSEKPEDSDSLYIAAVGGVLGVLVLIGFIIAMVLLFRRSKYHQSKTNEPPADNFPSGSTNDSQPMHDSEALQNSQQMNNKKNDRTTTNHTQQKTKPAFDGEISHPIFSKDIVDDSVHHQTGDNVTGHVYNDIDSKTDSQSGFVENDRYRPCSFGPDSIGARPEFQVKLTDNILYESSDHDMMDSKGDGVYYSAIGNGETVEMKDNIAYESASLRQ